LRPASKIGTTSCGAKLQAKDPALEQARQLGAGAADAGAQRDSREERCPGGADVGVGCNQLLLGLADVGPAVQQVRGQACGQVGQHRVGERQARAAARCGRRCRQRIGGHGLTEQQRQRVFVQRSLSKLLRQRDARTLEQ
jgi:hypothetical protein